MGDLDCASTPVAFDAEILKGQTKGGEVDCVSPIVETKDRVAAAVFPEDERISASSTKQLVVAFATNQPVRTGTAL